MVENLQVEQLERNGVVVVAVAGELDAYTAPKLRQAVVEALAGRTDRLVMDLSSVRFIDSTGLGVLLGVRRRLPAPGQLRLVVTSVSVARLLSITGLHNVFETYQSRDGATGRAGPPGAV